jgi:hypothetical protein
MFSAQKVGTLLTEDDEKLVFYSGLRLAQTVR